jgi:SAM-dependent methyltransferase
MAASTRTPQHSARILVPARRRTGPRPTARSADRHDLYQRAVQAPETDVALFTRAFRRERGRLPLVLREDFCGTALLCAEWVRSHAGRRAEGFDIDPEPVRWAELKHLGALPARARARVRVHERDVRERGLWRADVRAALNFSYCVFHERRVLLAYLRDARASLARDGLLVLDVHGGPAAIEDLEESRAVRGGFSYVWEQQCFDPFSARAKRHITFRFRDGTRMRRAFTYDWRLWTAPELRDLLADAGFARVDVYAEGWTASGRSGNGVYRRATRGENCASWIAYLLAWK